MASQDFRPKIINPKDLIKRWKILKGDRVEIIEGKDKGKQGVVQSVIRKRNSIIVEGCNLTKRYVKPTDTRSGAIVLKESLIHVTNVALVDPDSGQPTRVFYRKDKESGSTLRVAVASGAVIPKPAAPERERKFNAQWDTDPVDVLEETYVPPPRRTEPGPLAALRMAANHTQARREYRHVTDFTIIGCEGELLEAAIAKAHETPPVPYPAPLPRHSILRRRFPLKKGSEIGYPNHSYVPKAERTETSE
jgi:large subunit ribosomal protein L24